jgi:hypothetical protein
MRTYMSIALITIAGAGATPLSGADSSATDFLVRATPGVWDAQLGGDLSYQGPGIPSGTTTSPKELDLGRHRIVPQIEVGAQIPFLFSFYAGADLFSEDGTTTLTRTIAFGGHSYTGGTAVSTSVSLHDYWGEIGVRPINFDRVGVAIGIAGHAIHAGVDFDDPTLGVSDRIHKTLVVPALALRAHVRPIGSLTVEARVHAIDAGVAHQHFEYVDASGQVDYRPIPLLGIYAGYRYTLYDLHLHNPSGGSTAASFDIHLTGPFAGLVLEF